MFLVLMVVGRNRITSGGRGRHLTDDERADLLDQVLENIPDIGPAGPADQGPLVDQDDTFTAPVPETDRTTPAQGRAPVGGTTAEFRRAEASISSDGTIKYRIVAKDDAGNEYYSDLLDEDPTVAIMEQGNEVQLMQRRDGWVVDFVPTDDD